MGKFYDGIMGLVVGDALGVPFEFKPRDTFKAVDMVGYGTHHQPSGTWSDDSSMTLATVRSLVDNGAVDLDDIMTKFFRWRYHGDFTPYGLAFDVGGATDRAIRKYANGCPVSLCGGREITDNGNGALMRILPLAFYPGSLGDVIRVASLTHNHPISSAACSIYVAIAGCLISGFDAKRAVLDGYARIIRLIPLPLDLGRIPDLERMGRDEIKSTGYVVDTLEAALWCLLNSSSYRECVLMAVNLGGDTDTVAAVAGGLAGILYGVGGEKGIPEEWIDQIARQDSIKGLCQQFEKKFQL